jgi:hypothetical protein
MLIRVRGGSTGIKEYLERGQKDGRDFTREQLDERVMLAGDLELTDTVIKDMQREGERYLHITLAFKEDVLPRETLQAITDEFRAFAMAAYQADEYSFYAEAHLPKIKSYINRRTGQDVERKPHVHIVIPKVNLLSGTVIDPLYRPVFDKTTGRLLVPEAQLQWLEAFQEQINAKYGLASPKDHRRVEFTDESVVIARYKGDIFNGERAELKNRLLDEILKQDIRNFERLADLAAEHGEIRIRRSGLAGSYINVKPEGAAKGTNLKEWVFSREFIELPVHEKQRRLSAEAKSAYVEAGQAKPTSEEIVQRLQHWHQVRSRELKYINAGSRKVYAAYREADPEQRRLILDEREASFYQRHRKAVEHELPSTLGEETKNRNLFAEITEGFDALSNARADKQALHGMSAIDVAPIDIGTADLLPRDVSGELDQQGDKPNRSQQQSARRIGETDNVVGQLNRDLGEKDARKEAEREEFARIKSELDASRLLARLSHSHGLTPEKYGVVRGTDGSDRVKAGSRKLNVSDFLTKELHLPWKEASEILRLAYAEQLDQEHEPQVRNTPRRELWEAWRKSQPERKQKKSAGWVRQRESETERRAKIRSTYQAKRRAIYNDKALKPAQRKAALSVAQMDRVGQDIELRAAVAAERIHLKEKHARPRTEQYKDFLQELANQGDEGAIAELRRQRATISLDAEDNSIECAEDSKPREKLAHIARSMSYTVDRNGSVTYYADMTKRRALVVDQGQRVRVEAPQDRDAVEIGLRLALQKFGSNLDVQGSDEFKAQLIEAALKNNLAVEFSDPKMRAELEHRRVERDELVARGQAFIDQERVGSVKKAGEVPSRSSEPLAKQPEHEKQPEKSPKRPDRER